MRIVLIPSLMVLMVGVWTSAHAITVTNLDSVSHVLHMEHTGGVMAHYTLPPNATHRFNGAGAWIAVDQGKALYAIDNNDYAIWDGGRLRVQKYRKYGGDRH